ncbi:uncharacterized protein LOC131619128 [Vicia villosa]|uniref:uncharacterized protein LOC131619128 n=1 Tax=Vicia villosa TaxID=3911 RepID=UPI00273BE265|nr:uncharacterized protein LOC131619128 [Vicia villosa]
MWLNMKVKDNMLFQKSRVRWDRERDLNSKYFHSILKARKRCNFIGSIVTDRGVVEEVGVLRRRLGGILRQSSQSISERPLLKGIHFNSISIADKRDLEVHFSEEEEIKVAVWGCEGSRSPGLDKFNFFFIRKCRNFMKEDLISFFNDFYAYGVLSKTILSSFITLIAKRDCPKSLDDYWLIFLVGCL